MLNSQHGRCADKRTCRKGSQKINDLKKCGTKKALEFDGPKMREKLLRKYQSVDVGISDNQQQQTESMLSSTDTMLAVKPSVISVSVMPNGCLVGLS